MNLYHILKECAVRCNIGTFLYTTRDKAGYMLDNASDYPVLLWLFGERSTESRSGLYGMFEQYVTLYFYESLGEVEADLETQIAPRAERMRAKAYEFVMELRNMGVDIIDRVQFIPSRVEFDAILVGCQCNIVVSYKDCEYGRHKCNDR